MADVQRNTASASGSLPPAPVGGISAQSMGNRASSHTQVRQQQNVVIDIESEDLTYNQARSIRL
jgi:hypothetical protein